MKLLCKRLNGEFCKHLNLNNYQTLFKNTNYKKSFKDRYNIDGDMSTSLYHLITEEKLFFSNASPQSQTRNKNENNLANWHRWKIQPSLMGMFRWYLLFVGAAERAALPSPQTSC